MKLKLLSFLLILLVLAACRNDHLQDLHYQEEGAKNQLVSKIISLNESVHKNKIAPQLSKTKYELKKNTAFSKGAPLGEITIDTEHVIYIENGPNYHTYTFAIERTNPSPNDPIENLLLTPLPDGTYKEFLVIYNFTEQEKENISNGNYSYSGSNTTITELASGTFNTNGALARQFCGWETRTGWNPCSSSDHDGSNFHECAFLNNLSAGTPPTTYTYSVYVCPQDETIAPSDPPESGGGGGGGSLDPPCETCPPHTPVECIEVPTDPTQPSTGIGDDGRCIVGIPTLPNLPNPKNNTPCLKIKANFEDDRFKEKVAAIDKPSVFNMDHEMGYAAGYPINTSLTEIQYPPMENKVGTHSVTLPSGSQYFGFIHSHTDDNGDIIRARIFSNADVATFLTSCVRNAQQHGDISDAYAMVITSEGNYMLKYTGTGNFNIGPGQLKNWSNWYNKKFRELVENDELTQTNLEKMFMRFLNESVNIPGLEIYHIEKNTGKASKMNNDATKKPCP